jgi:hypothetical protein
MWIFVWLLALLLILPAHIWAQGSPYTGPDDPAGDDAAIREGYMDGNRIYLYYQNTSELAYWISGVTDPLWSRWPNNFEGERMLEGVGLLIGAKVYVVENDTIPVTNPVDIQNGYVMIDGLPRTIVPLYYLQSSYREEMDTAPGGFPNWGLYPVFGYFNETSECPAISDDENSWPAVGWPSTGNELKWPGEWNGRFGRGVFKADLETYFVDNDAQDQEYLGIEDQTKYYPRPGMHIGYKRQSTIQNGLPWGGIGIRVSQRGFQWNNPQARDAIFWEYSIANISDYDLTEVAFGYWVDNGIGGDLADDELGYFDRDIDMAYSWDYNGIGRGGIKTGTMGFAYLESPGLGFDGQDNDNDGLLDERRNNDAGVIIGPTDGINNLNRFLEVHKLKLEELKDHYQGDEDQDWLNGTDVNGNGTYVVNIGTDSPVWVLEPGEDAGNDVGLDGVGPTDLNYNGPDEGEGNGKPDFRVGTGCEPNFNLTDVAESDMVGLTSFQLFPVPPHSSNYHWFRGDESMWNVIGRDSTLEFLGTISNLIETFASGPFPLYQGEEERISMSELHSFDPLEGLQSDYSAPALFRLKEIVQIIYENDYQFARPPEMPTLSATAGDGQVILTWDNRADKLTREPLLNNANDFEGYKLFRATDKFMSDATQITDGYGDAKYLRPLFQCDLKDGISFFTDFGMIDGVGYNLGNETGIVHHFVDNNVQNGRTYYYGLIAYDYGMPDMGPGVSPSENNIVIRLDEKDNIIKLGKNVAVVIPHQPAAGYVPPGIEQGTAQGTLGTGKLVAEIMAKADLKTDHTYKVKFSIDTISTVTGVENAVLYTNNGLTVYDVTSGSDVEVYHEDSLSFSYNNLKKKIEYFATLADSLTFWTLKTESALATDVFDGLRITLDSLLERPEYDFSKSGWKKWQTNPAQIRVIPSLPDISYYPWDFDLIFSADTAAYRGKLYYKNIYDESYQPVSRRDMLFRQAFNFYIINSLSGDTLDLVVHDQNDNSTFDILEDRILAGTLTPERNWGGTVFAIDFKSVPDSSQLPQPGDVYSMSFKRPFWVTDSILFTVKPEGALNTAELKVGMDEIKVVPNPYVATNTMEEALRSSVMNQQRKIMFTHIPARCTIKIFTTSGLLVNTLEVNNPAENGTVHWDLLTKEGLEIAAGIYIFYVKSIQTGEEKLGKFAVVK